MLLPKERHQMSNKTIEAVACEHVWKRVGGDESVGEGDYYECRLCGEQKPDERPWDRDFDE